MALNRVWVCIVNDNMQEAMISISVKETLVNNIS